MKKILLLAGLLALVIGPLAAQDNRPQIKVGGLFFLHTHYDSYKSVDSHEGVSYSYPVAPDFGASNNVLNGTGQFSMSVYATRLHVEASRFRLLDANARLYAETDFLGSGNTFLMRLRHAYLDLRWECDELLFGQTNNLMMPEEVSAGVLTSGAGSPIAVLERPTMFRYGRALGGGWKAYAAASYHRAAVTDPSNPESASAARNNGFPTAEVRLQYTSPVVHAGIAGGVKSVRPRTMTAANVPIPTDERFSSYSATAFLRLDLGGYRVRVQAVAGTDLTHLGMIGGYGERLYEDNAYTGFLTGSGWLDVETRSFNNFRGGVFGGYMKNFGADEPVDSGALTARSVDLVYTGRLAPRLTYTAGDLLLGIEYSLYWASWGQTFNERHRPSISHDRTYNHRATLLVRYAF